MLIRLPYSARRGAKSRCNAWRASFESTPASV